MSNDTALSILLICLLAMSFLIGALMGMMRRDTEWRRHLKIADQRSADIDNHWETAIK
jgi:hypothetical protein